MANLYKSVLFYLVVIIAVVTSDPDYAERNDDVNDEELGISDGEEPYDDQYDFGTFDVGNERIARDLTPHWRRNPLREQERHLRRQAQAAQPMQAPVAQPRQAPPAQPRQAQAAQPMQAPVAQPRQAPPAPRAPAQPGAPAVGQPRRTPEARRRA